MISNPQGLNRLGHFFTPDFKSGGAPSGFHGAPSGLAFLKSTVRRPGGFAIRRQKMFDLLKPGDL